MTVTADGWFVLAHYPGPGWDEALPFPDQPGISQHIVFMRGLAERGVLALGGPFADAGPSRDERVGMAVVRAPDALAAEALAAEDESVRAGLLRVRVREWLPKMGSALA